jgi:imidazolonepropionase-like amidohydrolase
MQRIEADVLIPGVGDVVRNGCVVVDGAVISYAGPVEDAPKAPSGTKTIGVAAVMPGLWDVHGHFMGLRTANFDELPRTPVPVMASRVSKDAERALMAGFTSVREPGGLGVYLSRVVDEGTVPGPHIYGAGAALSVTGGHGDLHAFPLEFADAALGAAGLSCLCDGVPACLRGVRTQLRRGAKLIKVLASGGVMSELDHPIHQQFSDEELRAIVGEAARADRIVAAHCHGKPGILAALEAGCRTIEHGSYLDDEAAERMLKKNAILVPTRFIIERLTKFAKEAGVPDYAYEKFVAINAHHKQALRLAVKRGIPIALGSDIWMTGEDGAAVWGLNANELLYLVEAGMKPLQAIRAATANGPPTLGPQAPRSGQLKAGYDADILAVRENPVSNIGALASPSSIRKVWKSGNLVKDMAV